jgi:hypothetical protein
MAHILETGSAHEQIDELNREVAILRTALESIRERADAWLKSPGNWIHDAATVALARAEDED